MKKRLLAVVMASAFVVASLAGCGASGSSSDSDKKITVAASATIGYHQKPVILYNMKGFWNQLIALLDDLQAKGMIRSDWREYIKTADSIEEISQLLI